MCNSNAPTSLIEQGIVVRCHSGSFISNGLEKKRQIMPDLEILRSLWSLLYVKKKFLCDSQFLKTVEKKIWKGKHAHGQVVWKKSRFQGHVLWIVLVRIACVGFNWFLLGDSTETCRFGSLDQNRQPLIRIRSISWSNNLEININKLTQPNVHLQCTNKYDWAGYCIIKLPANAGSSWWPAACRRL